MKLSVLPKEILLETILYLNVYEIETLFDKVPELKSLCCNENYFWGCILKRNKTKSLYRFLDHENSWWLKWFEFLKEKVKVLTFLIWFSFSMAMIVLFMTIFLDTIGFIFNTFGNGMEMFIFLNGNPLNSTNVLEIFAQHNMEYNFYEFIEDFDKWSERLSAVTITYFLTLFMCIIVLFLSIVFGFLLWIFLILFKNILKLIVQIKKLIF